jgi:hypothetical protein
VLTASGHHGFAIGHLLEHLRFLDVAVDDFEDAFMEFRAALDERARVVASSEDPATEREGAGEELLRAAVRFYYRVESTYSTARRILDHVVVVAHQLLPRTGTDLGNTHHGFRERLERRCSDLELAVPEALLNQIDDLDERIRQVRDRIEHPLSPRWVRVLDARAGLAASRREVVLVGQEAEQTDFEPAGTLRDAIHAYVLAMVEFLKSSLATLRPQA